MTDTHHPQLTISDDEIYELELRFLRDAKEDLLRVDPHALEDPDLKRLYQPPTKEEFLRVFEKLTEEAKRHRVDRLQSGFQATKQLYENQSIDVKEFNDIIAASPALQSVLERRRSDDQAHRR